MSVRDHSYECEYTRGSGTLTMSQHMLTQEKLSQIVLCSWRGSNLGSLDLEYDARSIEPPRHPGHEQIRTCVQQFNVKNSCPFKKHCSQKLLLRKIKKENKRRWYFTILKRKKNISIISDTWLQQNREDFCLFKARLTNYFDIPTK